MPPEVLFPLAREWNNSDVKWCIMCFEFIPRSLEIVDMIEMPEMPKDAYFVSTISSFPM
jgi:hypothetical protein